MGNTGNRNNCLTPPYVAHTPELAAAADQRYEVALL